MSDRFRMLAEGTLTGIYLIEDGLFQYVNPALARMFGYAVAELVGRLGPLDLVYPDDQWLVATNLRRRLEGEIEEVRYRFRSVRKDGSVFPAEVHGRRIEDEGKIAVIGTIVDETERLRIEGELRATELRWREAERLAHVGWWERDLISNKVSLSDEVRRTFGIDAVDLPEWHERWVELIHPEDRARAAQAASAALAGGPRYDVEYRVVRPNGEVRVVHSQGDVTFDASGKPVRQFGVLQDVTEQRRAEDELRDSEARFRIFVDNASDAFFIIDDRLITIDVNQAACKSLGYSRDELIGMSIGEYDASPPDAPREQRRQQVAAGETITFEALQRRKDGSVFPVEIRVSPFEDGQRRLAIARNITERKRAERRQVAQQAVTRVLEEAATIEEATPRILQAVCDWLGWDIGVLWQIDRNAGVLRCAELSKLNSIETPRYEAATRNGTYAHGDGLPGRVWAGRAPIYLADCAAYRDFPRAEAAARDGLHAVFAFPVLLGGEVLGVMEFISRAIEEPDQEMLDIMATFGSQIGQFIERKRAENALYLARAELAHVTRVMTVSALTASIAHEINQPIGATVANASAALRWLSTEPPNLSEVRQALERMVKDGIRTADVVERIREIVRKAPPRRGTFDINDIVREVVEFTRGEASKSSVAVRTDLGDDLPLIQGDRVQLQQVILNLAVNAIDAMSDVGRAARKLQISTSTADGNAVLVAVRDSGPGLAPEVLAHLFEPFITTKAGGLGLGLSICREIVEAHGGRLWAATDLPRGALFQFTLPAGAEIGAQDLGESLPLFAEVEAN